MKVLNFGSMNLDYVYQVDHFVMPGETISATDQQVVCGGKGLNQSVALSRAGAETYHAGCMGMGGEMLKQMLSEAGVHTEYIREVEQLQGNAMIQVDASGQNCILLFGGSNQCVTRQQIRETLDAFEPGDYLVLQNEINEIPYIVDEAYEREMKIVLNPSPYDSRLEEVDFSKLSWLLVNEVEAEQISGSNDPGKAWEILHQRYPELSVVITLGKEGSICYTKEKRYEQPALEVKAVDTTAAGDTFTGFFLASLMEGKEIGECMRLASIAASISVTRKGAAPSIPNKKEVE